MTIENNEFVYILADNNPWPYTSFSEYLEHNGKWLIYGPRDSIHAMLPILINIVGKNGILQAKYSKNPALQTPEGYELGRDYVFIVYCDDRNRNDVRKILEKELNVNKMFWKYDRQTIEENEQKKKEI